MRTHTCTNVMPRTTVVHVYHTIDGDCGGINVQPHETIHLLRCQLVWVRLVDAQAVQATGLDGREGPLVALSGTQATEQCLIRLRAFVEHARVNGGREQVVGDGDGVQVARQVQVELLHGDHLGVAAPSGTALDAKRGTH